MNLKKHEFEKCMNLKKHEFEKCMNLKKMHEFKKKWMNLKKDVILEKT